MAQVKLDLSKVCFKNDKESVSIILDSAFTEQVNACGSVGAYIDEQFRKGKLSMKKYKKLTRKLNIMSF